MEYQELYESWLNDDFFDKETREELLSIKGDYDEVRDRFYKNLEFGTAGLRGKIGAGTNRMNKYTVALASQGLASTIKSAGQEAMKKGVIISYDVRYFSKEFAEIAAGVLAANKIKVYLSDDIRPTPVLAYGIRYYNTQSGIMVTASHNPKEYNGYKVYWNEGSQILDDVAEEIITNIEEIGSFKNIDIMPIGDALVQGYVEYIGNELDEAYFKDILSLSINDNNIDKLINIAYSPLNGTGNYYVKEILKRRGFTNVHFVEEQEKPDPEFSTVGYPNPEDPQAFKYLEKLGEKYYSDILIATDPDADRLAIEVLDENFEYKFINGNKLGILLVNYILSQRYDKGDLPENSIITRSIVTGNMVDAIAKKYGVKTELALTGFKNICSKVSEYENTKEKNWIFGFEESIGYSYGTFVRDKDGISTAMMVAEMAGYYKNQGKTLFDVLAELYDEFGYYNDKSRAIVLDGIEGQNRINRIMEDFRNSSLEKVGDLKLENKIDYLYDETGIPKSNVLIFEYSDNSWFALRPSGTEPKLKLYIYAKGKDKESSDFKIKELDKAIIEKIQKVM